MKFEYEDEFLRKILVTTKTIAMVGLSADEKRPSNFAARYLQTKGYKIIPINPITKYKYILKDITKFNLKIKRRKRIRFIGIFKIS